MSGLGNQLLFDTGFERQGGEGKIHLDVYRVRSHVHGSRDRHTHCPEPKPVGIAGPSLLDVSNHVRKTGLGVGSQIGDALFGFVDAEVMRNRSFHSWHA